MRAPTMASRAAYRSCDGASGRRAQLLSCIRLSSGLPSVSCASFDSALAHRAEYTAPLGVPKWAVAGKELVDTKACAAAPSPAALDCLWSALGGSDDLLSRDAVIAQLRTWATSDDLGEAVLFSEFLAGLSAAA